MSACDLTRRRDVISRVVEPVWRRSSKEAVKAGERLVVVVVVAGVLRWGGEGGGGERYTDKLLLL